MPTFFLQNYFLRVTNLIGMILNGLMANLTIWLGPDVLDSFCQVQQTLLVSIQWQLNDMLIETLLTRKGMEWQSSQTMATWIYSIYGTMTLTRDLKRMYVDDANVQGDGCKSHQLRWPRSPIIACSFGVAHRPMDPVTRIAGGWKNISNGQIAQPNVTVHRALSVGWIW